MPAFSRVFVNDRQDQSMEGFAIALCAAITHLGHSAKYKIVSGGHIEMSVAPGRMLEEHTITLPWPPRCPQFPIGHFRTPEDVFSAICQSISVFTEVETFLFVHEGWNLKFQYNSVKTEYIDLAPSIYAPIVKA